MTYSRRILSHQPLHYLALALLAGSIWCQSCPADQILDQGLSQMAEKVQKFLAAEGLPQELIVGDFTAPPRLRASGGVEISRSISEHLSKAGVKVHDDAEFQLLGKFFLRQERELPEDEFESTCLEIEATLLDGNDEEIAFLPLKVFGSVALQLTGQTIDVSVNLPEDRRQEMLSEQLRKAPTSLDGTLVRSSPGSAFSIEVLINENGRFVPRQPAVDSKNRAFVPLHRGEEYAVRIVNSADFDAGVTLQIDGVNMFVDAKDIANDARLIVRSGKSTIVPGWYINSKSSKAFEIGSFSESVAGRLGQSLSVGTITATFTACWDPASTPPSDEPSGSSKGLNATKQGRDIEKKYQSVSVRFGGVRSIVSVRYNQ